MNYYDILDDIQKHPDAWLYIIVAGRHTGKTYFAGKMLKLQRETMDKRTRSML